VCGIWKPYVALMVQTVPSTRAVPTIWQAGKVSAFVCGPNCAEQSVTKHSPTAGSVTPADCVAVVAGTSYNKRRDSSI